jgi:hypothetical protein
VLTPVLAETLPSNLESSTIDRLRLRDTPKRSPEDFSRVSPLAVGGRDGSRDKDMEGGIDGALDIAREEARFIGRGRSASGESGILSNGKTFERKSLHCPGNALLNLSIAYLWHGM